MEWAPLNPQILLVFSQNSSNCCKNGPVGHKYSIYSLGIDSSRNPSLTWANSQSEAS